MHIYNTFIEFSQTALFKTNPFFLLEDAHLVPSLLPYVLEFNNNQNRNIELRSNKIFNVPETDRKWMFTVCDVVSFMWKSGDNHIYYRLYKYGNMNLMHYWLAHTLFPIYLILEKQYYVLHVGAVSVENKSIAFMANSFGGKSTLTDYFLQKNHALVTDDKLVTFKKEGRFYAIPSYPFHRPYRDMETLGRHVENFEREVRPIESIYVLEKSDAKADISMTTLKGIEKFKELRYGSEMDFSFMFEQGVRFLSQLAAEVQLYRVSVPWDMRRLEEVYNAIIKHQKSLL